MNFREWALPVYTILMQIAAGAFTVQYVIYRAAYQRYGRQEADRIIKNPTLVILFTIGVAMLSAHFHLSKPQISFFALLNLGSSWLSREIFFTQMFFLFTGLLIALQWRHTGPVELHFSLSGLAIVFAWANEYAMAHIYLLPVQVAWNTPLTVLLFFGSTVLLGSLASIAMFAMDLKYWEMRDPKRIHPHKMLIQDSLKWVALVGVVMVAVIILGNLYQIVLLRGGGEVAQTSLMLLLELYQVLFGLRLALIAAGIIFFTAAVCWWLRKNMTAGQLMKYSYLTFLLVLIGEILGRFLFYATHVRTGI